MMGLPYSDAALLKPLADQVTRPDGTMTMPQVMQAFSDYLAPRLAACRIDPQPGLLSHIANGVVDDRKVTEAEAHALGTQIFLAGLDTVAGFLGFMMNFLARNPQRRQTLIDDRASIPAAGEEFSRRLPRGPGSET